ncbi:MAG: hypothetical protein KatS3mg110_3662 [Pirellulaceae bacterium]|nr:MAG: hypothetical protein KatS3mg110_3662 [Pirellulaceae bacterium]
MVRLERRRFLRAVLAGGTVGSCAGWFAPLVRALQGHPARRRRCVVLWMAGGPSHLDTFDPKPGHANAGDLGDRPTSVAGLRIGELLPRLAQWAHRLAPVRSLSTREGDHTRATYAVRTGRRPGGPIADPDLAALLGKELASQSSDLPHSVSIDPPVFINPAAFSPGFLGASHASAVVGVLGEAEEGGQSFPRLGLDYLEGLTQRRTWRKEWLQWLESQYVESRKSENALAHQVAYQRALRLLESPAAKAFSLEQEPDQVRERYGKSVFGQGCLLARRLLEQDVPFVEVCLGSRELSWDTHNDNFSRLRKLCEELDTAWSALLQELDERGLLEETTLLWIGEFGRTPAINQNAGRDHYPDAWSCVFAGGGIRGGQAFGKTSAGGEEVVEGKVSQADVLATLAAALGVDPARENITPLGRPVKLFDGTPIRDLLT